MIHITVFGSMHRMYVFEKLLTLEHIPQLVTKLATDRQIKAIWPTITPKSHMSALYE